MTFFFEFLKFFWNFFLNFDHFSFFFEYLNFFFEFFFGFWQILTFFCIISKKKNIALLTTLVKNLRSAQMLHFRFRQRLPIRPNRRNDPIRCYWQIKTPRPELFLDLEWVTKKLRNVFREYHSMNIVISFFFHIYHSKNMNKKLKFWYNMHNRKTHLMMSKLFL